MRIQHRLIAISVLAAGLICHAEKKVHDWKTGKVLDENRARYFAGMLNNSSSNASENGSWSGNANSVSNGDSTNTTAEGSYSGTRTTSTSGSSIPIYRVYDNLVIEGDDAIYITSERLRWRWSHGAHVSVNGTIQYYVEGRKLHVLDDDQKEHTIDVLKTVLKTQGESAPRPIHASTITAASDPSASLSQVAIDSTPSGADIELDGAFVGSTPSTIPIKLGSHEVSIKKRGYLIWSRTFNVSGGSVHLNAELEQETSPRP